MRDCSSSSVGAPWSVDVIHLEAAAEHVRVDVVETGDDGAAVRVDDRGLRTAQAFDLVVAADQRDPIPANGDGLPNRAAVSRINVRRW